MSNRFDVNLMAKSELLNSIDLDKLRQSTGYRDANGIPINHFDPLRPLRGECNIDVMGFHTSIYYLTDVYYIRPDNGFTSMLHQTVKLLNLILSHKDSVLSRHHLAPKEIVLPDAASASEAGTALVDNHALMNAVIDRIFASMREDYKKRGIQFNAQTYRPVTENGLVTRAIKHDRQLECYLENIDLEMTHVSGGMDLDVRVVIKIVLRYMLRDADGIYLDGYPMTVDVAGNIATLESSRAGELTLRDVRAYPISPLESDSLRLDSQHVAMRASVEPYNYLD